MNFNNTCRNYINQRPKSKGRLLGEQIIRDYKLLAEGKKEEAKKVREIIKMFKFHMHPELVGGLGLMFLYPSEFEIKYMSTASLVKNKTISNQAQIWSKFGLGMEMCPWQCAKIFAIIQ